MDAPHETVADTIRRLMQGGATCELVVRLEAGKCVGIERREIPNEEGSTDEHG